jgi:hypothetical protein
MVVARNVAIVLLLAAAVAFLPGGGDGAAIIGGILSTLILVSLVVLLARFYRERRLDIEGLGHRWRAVLYGALGVVVLVMAGRGRLFDSQAGTLVWIAAIAGASYAVYLVWRHYREYA